MSSDTRKGPFAADAVADAPPSLSRSLFHPDRQDDDDADQHKDTHHGREDHVAFADAEVHHSEEDFEQHAQIRARAANAVGAGEEKVEHDYFPEDERSSHDWEHDTSEIDPDAEIEAKLGKEPPAPPRETQERRPDPAPTALATKDEGPVEHYFPEDEHSSLDWDEDDHSTADHDPEAEVEQQLAAKQAPPSPAPPHEYYPEDEHSSMDWEDDHSDHDHHKDAHPAHFVDEDEKKKELTDDADGHMHPGLAAALNASLDYAKRDAQETPQDKEDPAAAEHEQDAKTGDQADDDDDDEEEDNADRPMTLRDHLTELRKRVFRAFLWALLGFIGCYPFAEKLFDLLMAPLITVLPSASNLIFTSPPEAFFTYMKVAFVLGLFAASPLIFYQIWAFVAPGLYKEEKAHIVPVAFFSALFFICGGAFCYFITFPFVFKFFMSYSTATIVAMPSLTETLSFVLQLLLAFGLIFELPLFVFFLARLGILTAEMMRKFRRYALLVNVIVAAILTPPDVMSQLLMAGPLVLLYELSILIAAVFGKKKPAPPEEEAEEETDDEEESGPRETSVE